MRAIGWAPFLLLLCAGCATATGLSKLHESGCAAAACDGGAEDATTDAGSATGDDTSLDDSSDSIANDAPITIDSAAEAGDSSDGSPQNDAPTDSPSDGPSVKDAGDGGPVEPGGLLYYFPLAGDVNDHSGNGHNANVINNVSFTTGRTGNANGAAVFNGTSSYMTAPGGALPTGAAARTLTLWLNASSHQFGVVFWGKDNCTGFMFGLGTGLDNVTAAPKAFWGGCDDPLTMAVPMNAWTFLAAVFTPPAQVRVFVDKVGTTYPLGTPLVTHASSLWIGVETTGDSTTPNRGFFKGSIESVRIYDRALSDAEVGIVMALP
jgi:hypothetical protein